MTRLVLTFSLNTSGGGTAPHHGERGDQAASVLVSHFLINQISQPLFVGQTNRLNLLRSLSLISPLPPPSRPSPIPSHTTDFFPNP
jgi:hypothetical protein